MKTLLTPIMLSGSSKKLFPSSKSVVAEVVAIPTLAVFVFCSIELERIAALLSSVNWCFK